MQKEGDTINIFEIFGTIGLNDSGFNKGISNAISSMESLKDKQSTLISSISGIGDKLGTISTSITTAKSKYDDSVSSLAKYKQTLDDATSTLDASNAKLSESKKGIEAQKNVLSENQKAVAEAKIKYDALKEALGANAEATKQARAEYNAAKQTVDENKRAVGFLNAEYRTITEEVKNNRQAMQAAKSEYTANSTASARLEGNLSLLENEYRRNERALEDTENALQEVQREMRSQTWNNFKGSLSAIGDAAVKAGKSMGDMAVKMGKFSLDAATATAKGIGVISGAIGALGGTAVNIGIDFESAFAGVRKTVDATDEEFAVLEQGIRDMAKELPTSASAIAGVAEVAGQLGVETNNLLDFTRVMVDLGESTNLSADVAASSIAQFAGIVGMSLDNVDRLGSTIVGLGNNFATTESDIMEMGMRLAGAGAQVGMTESNILSFSTALSSVGINAEAGGSAFSKLMIQMELATIQGGTALDNFADVSGMTAQQFKAAFEEDASEAIIAFLQGLNQMGVEGSSVIKILDDMGIKEVILRDTILRAAGAADIFSEAIETGNTAWEENTALVDEANQRYATMESQIAMLKNNVSDLGIEFYKSVNEPLAEVVKTANGMVDQLALAFSEEGLSGMINALGSVIAEAITHITAQAPEMVNVAISLIESLIEGLSENSHLILDGVSKTFTAIIDGVKTILPEFVPLALEIITTLADAFIQWTEMLYTTGVEVITSLIQGISEKVPDLIPQAQTAIMNIVNSIADNLPTVLQSGIDILLSLVNGIAEMLPELIPVAIEAILTLVETLLDNIDSIIDAGINLIISLAEGIVNALPILMEKAPIIIAKLVDAIVENVPKLLEAAAEIILMLSRGIIDNAGQIYEAAIIIMSELSAGIISLIGKVWEAGKNIVESMVLAVLETDWIQVGKDVVAGIARGIAGSVGNAVSAIKNLASSMLGTAKDSLDMHSPSKLFEREVGAMIPAGVTLGIEKGTAESTKAAEKMAKETYSTAKLWIDDYRNDTEYLVGEELKMWEILSENYAAKTKERIEIDKKIRELEKKAVEEKAKLERESFEHSKHWIETKKFFGLLSLEEEVTAWERVQARYLEGSKEREEADKSLFTTRNKLEREGFEHSKRWIETNKFFGLLSLKEEIAAWERVQSRYLEGTEERMEADKNLHTLKLKLAEEQEKLTSKMQETEEKYNKAVDDRAKSIYNAFGLFDELKKKEEVSSKVLSDNLRDQVAEMNDWVKNIETLAARGIDEGLVDELRQMGPNANAEIKALASMSSRELNQYVEMWRQKHAIARQQAVKELEGLRKETNEEIEGLLKEMDDLVGTEAESIGVNLITSLSDSILSQLPKLAVTMATVGNTIVNSTNKALGIASPSKVFAQIGRFTGEGYINGIKSMAGQISNATNSVFGKMGEVLETGFNSDITARHMTDNSTSSSRMDSALSQTIAPNATQMPNITIQNMTVRDDNDIPRIARELYLLHERGRRGGVMFS